MAQYEFDISKDRDFKELIESIERIEKAFDSKDFLEFLANKCLKALNVIMLDNLNGYDEHSVFESKLDEYRDNNKYEILDNGILIYNDTNMGQNEMWWVSPKTRENYPDGISIAYIVEYGTGIKGTSQDDWQTEVHAYPNGEWRFVNPDTGFLKYSTGSEGRFIYQKLLEEIEREIGVWVDEYYEKEVD